MELNNFSDLSKEEFEGMMLGDSSETEADQQLEIVEGDYTPIDWRTKNVVGAVKDQG